MPLRRPIVTLACLAAAVVCAGFGPLDPPAGPIAPTPGPEPRIPVSAATTPGDATNSFRITAAGSYYLTGNITGEAGKNGIRIDVGDVTLDLNGFALIGVAGALDGVVMASFRKNVVIRDGTVRSWPGEGIDALIDSGRIERIMADRNGGWGIRNSSAAFTSYIAECVLVDNGDTVASTGGLHAGSTCVVARCVAYSNTGRGINAGARCVITECSAAASTTDGIACTGGTISACSAASNGIDGIVASQSTLIANCNANSNIRNGIMVASDSVVRNNVCQGNGALSGDGANILANWGDNRIESNQCTTADRGVEIAGTGNLVLRNTCSGNTTNWVIAVGNSVAPIVQAGTNGALISGNTFAGVLGSSDPNANYTY